MQVITPGYPLAKIGVIMFYYKRVDSKGKTTTVESYTHNLPVVGAVKISQREFNTYKASLPVNCPEPVRDLATEIDALYLRISKLEPVLK